MTQNTTTNALVARIGSLVSSLVSAVMACRQPLSERALSLESMSLKVCIPLAMIRIFGLTFDTPGYVWAPIVTEH